MSGNAASLDQALHDPSDGGASLATGLPTAPPVAKEVVSCLAMLPVLETQLRETIQQIEQGVVQVGDSFAGIAQRAREAVTQISRGETDHEKIACGQLIGETRQTMGRLMQRIEQTSRLSQATVQRMLEIEQRIQGLERTLSEIDSVAANARLLALNGQIEAARAGAHGAAFAIVATETAKMAVHAVGASKTIRQMIGELSTEISGASQDLRQRASADSEVAAESRGEVNRTLDCMGTMHDEMRQAMQQAKENSQRLAQDISHAVVAMQFQDAVSQRISHVIATLEEIDATLRSNLDPAGIGEPSGRTANDSPDDWTRRMAEQYTMDSEHKALAAHVAGGADDAEGLGDNVELF
jgi:methyl-accepting chemotaxis protein